MLNVVSPLVCAALTKLEKQRNCSIRLMINIRKSTTLELEAPPY